MGIDPSFGIAFYKSQVGAGQALPRKGKVFISVKNSDKRNIIFIAKKLSDLGFEIAATKGTHKVLRSNSVQADMVGKISEGDTRISELIKKGELKLIINTPSGSRGQSDAKSMRSMAAMYAIPCITTIQGAQAAVNGIDAVLKRDFEVKPIQEYFASSHRP
jgi:carbamoyl-phosphate synthase large subunit